jgi:hypothetical protein
MNRGLWFVAGAGAGIYVMIRGRRAAEALTVDGLQDRLNGLAVGMRMFGEEVAEGKAEAETTLRKRFSLAPDGTRELTVGQRRAQHTQQPAGQRGQEEEGRS